MKVRMIFLTGGVYAGGKGYIQRTDNNPQASEG